MACAPRIARRAAPLRGEETRAAAAPRGRPRAVHTRLPKQKSCEQARTCDLERLTEPSEAALARDPLHESSRRVHLRSRVVCCVANPRNSTCYCCVLRLAAPPDPQRTLSARFVQSIPRRSVAGSTSSTTRRDNDARGVVLAALSRTPRRPGWWLPVRSWRPAWPGAPPRRTCRSGWGRSRPGARRAGACGCCARRPAARSWPPVH